MVDARGMGASQARYCSLRPRSSVGLSLASSATCCRLMLWRRIRYSVATCTCSASCTPAGPAPCRGRHAGGRGNQGGRQRG